MFHVRVTRSLSVVYVGFCLARQREGVRGAVVTGLVCALWFELIYFAAAVLSDVIAAHCAIVAVWLGDDAARGNRRLLAAGALFGLAILLRMQSTPALLAAAL
jgi:4-amino-4-deoxy-L-arabinose transferase-like glycosyltransferase